MSYFRMEEITPKDHRHSGVDPNFSEVNLYKAGFMVTTFYGPTAKIQARDYINDNSEGYQGSQMIDMNYTCPANIRQNSERLAA